MYKKGVIFMDKQVNDQEIANHIYKDGDALTSFDDFKEYRRWKVDLGLKLGMDEEQLANSAQKVANYLADKQ